MQKAVAVAAGGADRRDATAGKTAPQSYPRALSADLFVHTVRHNSDALRCTIAFDASAVVVGVIGFC